MQAIVGVLPYIQIGIAILLITSVLLQQSSAGLGEVFGGSGSEVGFHTRRGFERTLFLGTIALGILFFLSSLIAIILQ